MQINSFVQLRWMAVAGWVEVSGAMFETWGVPAYGSTDSPVGVAAGLGHCWVAWTDPKVWECVGWRAGMD